MSWHPRCRHRKIGLATASGMNRNALIPTPHCDRSLHSKHRAMGTHDAYSIVLAPPCLRRRLRCRESAAHDLPQLRCATCAPVIGACHYYLVVGTLRSRTAESYANAGVRPVAITTPEFPSSTSGIAMAVDTCCRYGFLLSSFQACHCVAQSLRRC